MNKLSAELFEKSKDDRALFEKSKDDRALITGSEIRAALQEQDNEIQQLRLQISELLPEVDAADWWASEYAIANKERLQLREEIAQLKNAARDVLDMLPYRGLLDLPELRAAVEGTNAEE